MVCPGWAGGHTVHWRTTAHEHPQTHTNYTSEHKNTNQQDTYVNICCIPAVCVCVFVWPFIPSLSQVCVCKEALLHPNCFVANVFLCMLRVIYLKIKPLCCSSMEISSATAQLCFSLPTARTPTQSVRICVHPLDIFDCSGDVPWFFWALNAYTTPSERERQRWGRGKVVVVCGGCRAEVVRVWAGEIEQHGLFFLLFTKETYTQIDRGVCILAAQTESISWICGLLNSNTHRLKPLWLSVFYGA